MKIVLGLDLGTTSLTALALDVERGEVLARHTLAHQAESTSAEDRQRGFSEWNPQAVAKQAVDCLHAVATQLAELPAGLALTGQQHSVLLVGDNGQPLSPLIGWQDRRGEQLFPDSSRTYTQESAARIGSEAAARTGCRLATGYLVLTLFWMKERGLLPLNARACFLSDWFASRLTATGLVTDPTFAASSGVFDVAANTWGWDLIESLGLPRTLFPEVRSAGTLLGRITNEAAQRTGLPAGLPVFVGLGDNQASFLGSVAQPAESVLVNVGTGGQVAIQIDGFRHDPALETRPFPGGGYLLVCAGLSGGRVYALLERFFREVGSELFCRPGEVSVYEMMNRLAAQVPVGCDGLRCEPFFSGTRQEPLRRGYWSNVSIENWTPGHVTRALLEGMARSFKDGLERMTLHLPRLRRHLIGAGNGMRDNPLLREIVSLEFGMPVQTPRHHEEAAFGAALIAAVGARLIPNLRSAARLIRYQEEDG
jgi:sugar (pentulose or hexulose) kinase